MNKLNSNLRVFISKGHDPYFNLAIEDWIFRDLDPNSHLLFIWRNSPTVVIGRFQNPWNECHLSKMKEDQVHLVRRQSGGGAVYQDLGNTNFTFMSGRQKYKKENNNIILIQALQSLGIKARASGRNDLVVEFENSERKISGSAFKENRDRCFHHGTMLINVNLQKLGDYLNPSKKKLEAKGIASVRSRVANLKDINPEIEHGHLQHALIQSFFDFYQEKCAIEELDFLKTQEKKPEHGTLYSYYEHLKSDLWRLKETPLFTHQFEERFEWGEINMLLQVSKGLIEDLTIYSDSLHPEMIEFIIKYLKDIPYSDLSVLQAFHRLKKELPMFLTELLEMEDWIVKQIN